MFTSQVVEIDISKTYLARYVKENNLEKVAHGIYVETNYGHKAKTYDKERCICDLIIYRRLFEVQHFQSAMKGYMHSKEKDLSRLIKYAEKLNIRDEVMKYVEVLI